VNIGLMISHSAKFVAFKNRENQFRIWNYSAPFPIATGSRTA
jgi:hypothetical protein